MSDKTQLLESVVELHQTLLEGRGAWNVGRNIRNVGAQAQSRSHAMPTFVKKGANALRGTGDAIMKHHKAVGRGAMGVAAAGAAAGGVAGKKAIDERRKPKTAFGKLKARFGR